MNGAQFREENDILCSSANVLPKTSNLVFSRCCFADDSNEIDKNEKMHVQSVQCYCFCSLNMQICDVHVAVAVGVYKRELTKRRRRRQRRRYKKIGLMSKNNGSARSARAFYILVHFSAVIS